jgi:hypothetical protein
MSAHVGVDDIILNFDPAAPHDRFRAAGLEAALAAPAAALPQPVPWPAGAAPVAAPPGRAPLGSDDLSRFRDFDALVMTWTAAEGRPCLLYDKYGGLTTAASLIDTWAVIHTGPQARARR